MKTEDSKYLDIKNKKRIIRMELIFAPILIILPIIVAGFFIMEWYNYGFINNSGEYNIQLIIGLIIIAINAIYYINFIKSLKINLSS